MLISIKQRMHRDEDEGFTLIELMVVLLIIAILLAIAIPTFLGARNTANARATQENLRNALTAEQTNWTSNQSFNTGLSNLEPSLSWMTTTLTTKGGSNVAAYLYAETVDNTTHLITGTTAGTSTTADGVALVGYGKDNNCYAIYQSDNSGADFTAYSQWPAPSSGCAAPSVLPTGTATGGNVVSGSAAANPGSAGAEIWATSF